MPIACSYDLELAAAKYLHALADGEAPLALHFNGVVYYPNDDGGLQMVLIPWSRSIDFRMPVSVWRETVEHYYPNTGWVALRSETLTALEARRVHGAHADASTPASSELLGRRAMADALEQLVESLLYEGYALYPYTPGRDQERDADAVRDRLPAALRGRLDEHLRPPRAALRARAPTATPCRAPRCASWPPAGGGHRAAPRAARAAARRGVAALAEPGAASVERSGDGGSGSPLRVRARALGRAGGAAGAHEVALRVENRTAVRAGLSTAPRRSAARCSRPTRCCASRGGRFISPLERPCASVNTFPVLASAADDAVLGAAIVLPDHPQIAPESRGGLFDSTEIEEALLLHVQALSDAEREEIERDDPAVREMVARAAAVTPREIVALHGRVRCATRRRPATRSRSHRPRSRPAWPTRAPARTRPRSTASPSAAAATCGSAPAPDADLHARMLGRRARRRSSGSSSTTTARRTWASRSTTTPARS